MGAAPLALLTIATALFFEFFKLGRALRVTLPTGGGGVVHLFVVLEYQGAEEDAEKLQLTDKLLQAVLAEARVVCAGQPVLIAGVLNADPAVIPCLTKAISVGRFVDLALASLLGRGSGLRLPASSSWMSVLDLVGILSWVVLMRLLLPLLAGSLIGGFLLIFLWIDPPDRSASSVSRAVQDAWEVYRDVLGVVPPEVVDALRGAVSGPSVDDFWSTWSKSAEAVLFRGHTVGLVEPLQLAALPFLGRGLLRIRSRCLGGRAVGGRRSSRLVHVLVQGDEVDVHCSQYFVDSSLAPVVLFRRCASSLLRMHSKRIR